MYSNKSYSLIPLRNLILFIEKLIWGKIEIYPSIILTKTEVPHHQICGFTLDSTFSSKSLSGYDIQMHIHTLLARFMNFAPILTRKFGTWPPLLEKGVNGSNNFYYSFVKGFVLKKKIHGICHIF